MRTKTPDTETVAVSRKITMRSFPTYLPGRDGQGGFREKDDGSLETIVYDFLLVEDSRPDALLIKIALESLGLGYNLIHLERGVDVIPYLLADNDNKPDLLILDLGLPDLSGFDILEYLAALPAKMRDFPIVIVTGYEDFGYICNNPVLLIKGYVQKSSLRLTIHKAVRHALFD